MDPADQLAARLARDGDPEAIHIEENDTTFAIGWKGRYRIEGPAFIYVDYDTVSSQPSLATRRISSNRPILKFQICLVSIRSSAFSLPAFREVPAHIGHSGRGGRLLPILIGSPSAVAIVPAPVSAFTIISASCSTHTILVRASSPGILARHKPKGFMARRVTPSHVGLRRGPLLNRHLDCGLVGGCGGRSGYCCCRFISCRGNLRPGRNSFFRPRCWTRPRRVWDLS